MALDLVLHAPVSVYDLVIGVVFWVGVVSLIRLLPLRYWFYAIAVLLITWLVATLAVELILTTHCTIFDLSPYDDKPHTAHLFCVLGNNTYRFEFVKQ